MGKGRRNKRAKWAQNPNVSKTPKGLEAGEAANNATPFRWRCSWVDLDGEWGFHNITHQQLWREVIPRLHDLESMTWGEIYGRKDGSTHPMPVDHIERRAAERLRQLGKDDFDTLFQINIRGRVRVWGIRERAYFYLIWFDPNHTVYVQR